MRPAYPGHRDPAARRTRSARHHPDAHRWDRRHRCGTILSIVGDVGRFRSAGHFAAYNGTAPIEASSGDIKRHRLNRGGNRQLNSAIHIAAVTQVRDGGPGKLYLQRKLAEHKTSGEARRALKRQLSDVIYRRLIADQRRREAVRGGQTGTELASA